jgi:hypothetical protein
VTQCAYLATVGGPTDLSIPIAETAIVTKFPFDLSSVVVSTFFSASGAQADLPFSLLVIC